METLNSEYNKLFVTTEAHDQDLEHMVSNE